MFNKLVLPITRYPTLSKHSLMIDYANKRSLVKFLHSELCPVGRGKKFLASSLYVPDFKKFYRGKQNKKHNAETKSLKRSITMDDHVVMRSCECKCKESF